MNEQGRIKRELVRNTALLFIVFAIIFAVLGAFVYHFVGSNLYRSVDAQLTSVSLGFTPAATLNSSASEDVEFTENIDIPSSESLPETDASTGTEGAVLSRAATAVSTQLIEDNVSENPQAIYLMRDGQGNLIQTVGLYTQYPAFVTDVPFEASNLDNIYPASAEGHRYRAINNLVDEQGAEPVYLQTIINVDSETAIFNQFTIILIAGLVLALLISAGASYVLSLKTMKPITEAWQKQTEFVQNASHELRTPLTIIRASQELLLEHPRSTIVDRFEDITVTIEEAKRLSRLVDALLVLTTDDSGKTDCVKEPVALDDLLQSTCSLYADFAQAQDKTFELNLSAQVTIEADRDKLRQLFGIVFDNSIKYTEEGDTIRVTSDVQGKNCIVTIADTGCGIAPDDIDHVFERFYRSAKARSQGTDGNGLGLPIARSIVSAHGGTICVAPGDDCGTIITIELPRESTKTYQLALH